MGAEARRWEVKNERGKTIPKKYHGHLPGARYRNTPGMPASPKRPRKPIGPVFPPIPKAATSRKWYAAFVGGTRITAWVLGVRVARERLLHWLADHPKVKREEVSCVEYQTIGKHERPPKDFSPVATGGGK